MSSAFAPSGVPFAAAFGPASPSGGQRPRTPARPRDPPPPPALEVAPPTSRGHLVAWKGWKGHLGLAVTRPTRARLERRWARSRG